MKYVTESGSTYDAAARGFRDKSLAAAALPGANRLHCAVCEKELIGRRVETCSLKCATALNTQQHLSRPQWRRTPAFLSDVVGKVYRYGSWREATS